MENILTKALGDALTPLYSDELRDSYYDGYAFSPGFEDEMRKLVRNTDRPAVIRYTRFIAAAACAVIAIGSAVLIPGLMENRIVTDVSQTEAPVMSATSDLYPVSDGTSHTGSVTAPDVAALSGSETSNDETTANAVSGSASASSTEASVPAPSSVPVTVHVPEAVDLGEPDNIELITPASDEETTSSVHDGRAGSAGSDNDVISGFPDDDEIDIDEEIYWEDEQVNEDDNGADDDEEEDEEAPEVYETENEDDGVIEIEEDDESEEPISQTEPAETTAKSQSTTENSTVSTTLPFIYYPPDTLPPVPDDDDGEYDDDEEIDEVRVINVPTGKTLDEVFSENFGTLSFTDLFAKSCLYNIPGNTGKNNNIRLDFESAEYPAVQEFVHKLAGAKADASAAVTRNAENVTLGISDVRPQLTDLSDRFINNSAWLNYNSYFAFGGSGSYDDDEQDEDDETAGKTGTISFTVNVMSDTGTVSFTANIGYSPAGSDKILYYRIPAVFRMEASDTAALFEYLHTLTIPDGVGTTGDITSALGITPDDPGKVCAHVRGVYDTSLVYARIDGLYVKSLLSRYNGRAVMPAELPVQDGLILTMVSESGATLVININSDGYIYLSDNISAYRMRGDGELVSALKAVSTANGFNIPVFGTLEEYLADKSFPGITKAFINEASTVYVLSYSPELEELTAMLKNEFAGAVYISDRTEADRSDPVISLQVSGYRSVVRITEHDQLVITTDRRLYFKLSDGFTNRFRAKMLESEYLIPEEDELPEIDDDENPIT